MDSIREIKNVIGMTDCKNRIREGMWVSDPIITVEGGKIVDNYFVYSRNADGSMVAGQYLTFGIYTAEKKSAYIKNNENASGIKPLNNSIPGSAEIYKQYEKDFFEVRKWVMTEIDAEKKAILNRYIAGIEKLGGTGILEISRKAFPSFFEWADKYK